MCFVTKVFYGEELLAPRPTPKLEDHRVSAVRDCLFNIFAATLLIGDSSSIRNPRTRRAVVRGTHLSHGCAPYYLSKIGNILSSETRLVSSVSERGLRTCTMCRSAKKRKTDTFEMNIQSKFLSPVISLQTAGYYCVQL
jgi:hypothetical protein